MRASNNFQLLTDALTDMSPGARVVLLNWREDGVTPFVTIWKHGLTEMKV